MKQIKEQFEAEAKQYDDAIIKVIPGYTQMIRALIDSIPFDANAAIRVMDLGCGTGTLALEISEKYPNSKIVCLDIASNMIDIAKHKLAKHKTAEFVTGDFSEINFTEQFDVVVSSLALHHIESDKEKKELYAKIYDLLSDSGIFYNADVVLDSSDFLQDVNMKHWIEFMNKNLSMDEILHDWLPKHKANDRPAKLTDQLEWLKIIGFNSVDVIWKCFNFSVYGGIK